jgi:hypothetical protein
MNRVVYSMRTDGKQRAISKWLETHNTIMSPNPRSCWHPTLLNSVAWLPFEGSYQLGEVVCQDERASELEDIRESGSHTGSEVVRCREEHHCKEWKRGEVAEYHRDLVSWRDGELMRDQG